MLTRSGTKLDFGKWINEAKQINGSTASFETKKKQIEALSKEVLRENGLIKQIDLKKKLRHNDIPKTLSTLANRFSKFPGVNQCRKIYLSIDMN